MGFASGSEVNANTMSSGPTGIDVFSFSPSPDFPYVTEIAEMTVEDSVRFKQGAIHALAGWRLSDVEQIIDRSVS